MSHPDVHRGGRDRQARRALGRAAAVLRGAARRASDVGAGRARSSTCAGGSRNGGCRTSSRSSTEVPKTSVGKFDKKVLRARLADGHARQPHDPHLMASGSRCAARPAPVIDISRWRGGDVSAPALWPRASRSAGCRGGAAAAASRAVPRRPSTSPTRTRSARPRVKRTAPLISKLVAGGPGLASGSPGAARELAPVVAGVHEYAASASRSCAPCKPQRRKDGDRKVPIAALQRRRRGRPGRLLAELRAGLGRARPARGVQSEAQKATKAARRMGSPNAGAVVAAIG